MGDNDLLMQICTENVYKENIFHILGLPSNATPRQIRRRKDDFEIASNMGTDAWKSCFKHILGNYSIPTENDISECFSKLENPEIRIISEFFWFWPLDERDNSVQNVLDWNYEQSFKLWNDYRFSYGNTSIIATHNLAVLYHLFAISYEYDSLKEGQTIDEESRSNISTK